jgi:hypothetical protein
MRNLVVLLIVALAAWGGYRHFHEKPPVDPPPPATMIAHAAPVIAPVAQQQFTCDGRTHCSQMRSCAEATYFIRHCPGTKMDGDRDGVPCEQQFCR